jgi:hypothetical protein
MSPTQRKRLPQNSVVRTSDVKLIDNARMNNAYKKKCFIKEKEVCVYLDTGSEVNVMSDMCAKNLRMSPKPKQTVLRGFGGASIECSTECEFVLKIDGLALDTSAVLTTADMGDVDLIVGQPVINREGLLFLVSEGQAALTEELTNLLAKIILEQEEPRPRVIVKEETTLQARMTTTVPVKIEDALEGVSFYLAPKIHPVGGKLLCTPGGVLDATSPVIFLTNVGEEAIQVKAGRLVGRCESCQEAESSAVLGVSVSEKSLPIALCDVDYDKSLSHSERDQLFALLNRWSSCFANSTKDLNAVKGEGIEITLCEGTQPVCYRPCRLPLKEREYVREKVKDLLDSGIIRESVSNFASPVILVKKKTGDYRLCVDYRALNKKTVKNIYPMPNIEEQLTKLAGKVYFTSLDCSQGFHQIPVNPNSIEKTAFVTRDGHYE